MSDGTNKATNTNACRWCGLIHGALCPSVKAIEYHPDGTVKRVEFLTAADYPPVGPLRWVVGEPMASSPA